MKLPLGESIPLLSARVKWQSVPLDQADLLLRLLAKSFLTVNNRRYDSNDR
jgi:hypothetical protein